MKDWILMGKSTLFHLHQDGYLDARRGVLDADLGCLERETLGLELGVIVEMLRKSFCQPGRGSSGQGLLAIEAASKD